MKTACLFSFHACHITPIPSTEIKQSVSQSLGSRPTQVQKHFTLVPLLLGTTCCCLSVQSFQLLHSRNIPRYTPLAWPFLIDTITPDSPLMLGNCFIDFAVEHRFGCGTTEPAFAGEIGALER